MKRIIDLRSDTMTKPSPGMRQAIAEAEVGDDVWGEDPTVNKLETYAATMLGKPAAIFVPSGTMANQIAVRSLTDPGDEMIIETDAHIFRAVTHLDVSRQDILDAIDILKNVIESESLRR